MAKNMAKKKKEEPKIIIPEQFHIIAADLSLNRPGFSLWTWLAPDNVQIDTFYVDNKKFSCPGEKLDNMFANFNRLRFNDDLPVFYLREHAFNSRASQYEIGVFEMVGLSDWWIWTRERKQWIELYPVTIKKIVTGDSKADKKKVEESLTDFVGRREYKVDDESDATALAVAWLVTNGKLPDLHKKEEKKENDS